MRFLRYVTRRAVAALASIYAAATVAFLLATVTWRRTLAGLLSRARSYEYAPYPGGATEEEVARLRREFLASRGLDQPIHVRYAEWMWDITTLDLGYSYTYQAPVVDVLAGPVATTLTYVLPGVALGVVLGVLVGVAAALGSDGRFDWTVRFAAYALFALPAFAVLDYGLLGATVTGGSSVAELLVTTLKLPVAALVVAGSLLAGQVRFARAASLQQVGQQYVRLLHAKGTARLTVAKHVLRNASLPILSLSTSEVVSVLALDVYVVEFILSIDGLANVVLVAVRRGDVAILIWSTMVIVVVGIVGNLLTDVLFGYIDPRVQAG